MSMNAKLKNPPAARPSVVFNPDLLDGINTIANLVKPTLGPLPRLVAMERMDRTKAPELLDDAATLARRIVQLPNPTQDVGAMMLRHALWRIHEVVGDGAATTAVLAQALMQHAAKAVAAGANAMVLRHGIEAGIEAACTALKQQAQPVTGSPRARALLSNLVRSICQDEELAERLAEAVTFAGPDAYIEVVNHEPRRIDRDYIEGSLIETPWHNANFATDKGRTITRMEDVPFVIVEAKIESSEHAIEGLRRIHEAGHTKVAIMVGEVGEEAMNVFNALQHNKVMQIALIKSPGHDATRALNLQDIASLTGARLVMGDGQGFAAIVPEDIGFVRRLWVNDKKLGLIGGTRDSLALRTQIKIVRKDIETLRDLDRLPELRKRLGRLTSSWVMLRVGGVTSGHAEARQDQARRLVRALQMAVRSGVVAGGGAGLVACKAAFESGGILGEGDKVKGRGGDKVKRTPSPPHPFTLSPNLDYQMGVQCVAKALDAPMTAIVQNAGHEASPIVARVLEAGLPHGFDVVAKRMVNMLEAGVVDSVEVLERALRNAGSMAAMAITTDAVVHHREPALQVGT